MKKQFAVIGLGRFGGSICNALADEGMDVLAIDSNEYRVNEFAQVVTQAVIADGMDEKALRGLGIRNFDNVIVAIGDNIQASIMTTIVLDEIGVKHITVKAQNDYHEKVLRRIGAHEVIHPERDIGVRVAHSIVSKSVLDYLELSEDYSIVELEAGQLLDGKSLLDLDIRETYECNVLAIKRGEDVHVSPRPEVDISEGDILIIVGADGDIARLEARWIDDN
ncbi:TrkA family potassium uptake protein [Marinococcus halophilus]|uniref:Ktr system potassium uptake protein C n=1 Tax=Marinococcus halophilus TaxID=1371 RepID=A0A510Y1T9_MARHA|nr:TrkA family potassium uptake protein [Marinococcus halophilus]OZT81306.1 TrkA family potassium uptake protein [Marinococcus halophilus]GEK57249.1 ktr system potassium uptake protein C [Marinococcus halophilus]